MKHFIYTIFVCLFVLTGCDSEEPGYGYKDPVVYFSKAGILETKITGSEIPVSVYCSGNPDRGSVTASAAVEIGISISSGRLLYRLFVDSRYT